MRGVRSAWISLLPELQQQRTTSCDRTAHPGRRPCRGPLGVRGGPSISDPRPQTQGCPTVCCFARRGRRLRNTQAGPDRLSHNLGAGQAIRYPSPGLRSCGVAGAGDLKAPRHAAGRASDPPLQSTRSDDPLGGGSQTESRWGLRGPTLHGRGDRRGRPSHNRSDRGCLCTGSSPIGGSKGGASGAVQGLR